MRQRIKIFASCCIFIIFAGCGDNQPRRALPEIVDSFTGAHEGQVTLARRALGKSFMVLPTLTRTSAWHLPMPLAPKVVSFEVQGGTVAMLERNLNDVYSDQPSEKLVQTFSVTAQDEDTISFAWDLGLEVLPTRLPFVGSDEPITVFEAVADHENVLKIKSTFVRTAKVVDNGLELEQVSRVEQNSAGLFDQGVPHDFSVTVRTRIVPYLRNPHFEPRPSTLQRGVGYFETAHTEPATGRLHIQATRWDGRPEAGPITYLISRQTPPALVQAISDGVLYWNRVAGRDLVKVQTEADPDQPLRSRQVFIHWVSWQTDAVAATALQPDPATGEIVQGSIFIPSFFGELGAELLYRSPATLTITPQGFVPATVCSMPRIGLSSLLSSHLHHDVGLSVRTTNDSLRAVVAHEVGHSLGLRHNFAASGQSALADDRAQQMALEEYMRQSNHGGVATASSVMDYLRIDDLALLGAFIRHQALPYDVAAIQWGYSPSRVRVADLNPPPFCTDAHATGMVLGCDPHDSGPQPLAGQASRMAQHHALADSLLIMLAQAMRAQDVNSHASANDAVEAVLKNLRRADAVVVAMDAFRHLAQGASVFEVDQRLAGTRYLDEPGYLRETAAALGEAAEQAGGLPGLLASAYPFDGAGAPQTGWLARTMLARLHESDMPHAPAMARLGLSNSDRRELEAAMPAIGATLEQEVLLAMLEALTGDEHGMPFGLGSLAPSTFAAGVVRSTWQPQLADMARHIIMDTVPGAQESLPRPRFRRQVRIAATRLFSERLFGVPGWLWNERLSLLSALQERRELVGLRPILEHKRLDNEAQRWLKDELQVMNALQLVN